MVALSASAGIRRAICAALMTVGAIVHAAGAAGEPATELPRAERVVVVPDVHGAYTELLGLLKATGIVDDATNWRGGSAQLVSLGDLLDRGPDSRKVLDLLMRLESEATRAGGAVHVVLGNHEVLNLARELQYVPPTEYAAWRDLETPALRDAAFERLRRAGRFATSEVAAARAEFDAKFPQGYFGRLQALSPEGAYGRWLLARPAMLRIGETLFVHGGLSRALPAASVSQLDATLGQDLRRYVGALAALELGGFLDVDTEFRDRVAMARARAAQQGDEVAMAPVARDIADLEATQDSLVQAMSGPLWYRGSALCQPVIETDIVAEKLAALGARRVVVGHSVVPDARVRTRLDGRVILLDTGMLTLVYRGRPSALVIGADGDRVVQLGAAPPDGQPTPEPRRVGPRPARLDDALVQQLLTEGEIVPTDSPDRVKVRRGDVEIEARFSAASGWRNEVAAFELDRLLGLELVPVTVARRVAGREGMLQFAPGRTISLRERQDGARVSEWCEAQAQLPLLWAFDDLVSNAARTRDDIVYSVDDGRMLLRAHAQAFGATTRTPENVARQKFEFPAEFLRRLRALPEASLRAALAPYLRRPQIDALLKRRDRILRQNPPRARNATQSAA